MKKEQKDKFDAAAENEKRMIIEFANQKQDIQIRKFPEDKFSPWDFSMNSGSTTAICEIKVRDFEVDRYSFVFLESDKVGRLLQAKSDYEKKYGTSISVYFYNFFTNGLAVFEVTEEMSSGFKIVNCPKTTMGNNTYIPKSMRTFNLKNAIEIWYKK